MADKQIAISKAQIYTPDGIVNGGLSISGGKIAAIYEGEVPQDMLEAADEVIDAGGRSLVPGFIDVHVHGGGGYDVMAGSVEHIEGMSRFHAAKGTTSFLATTLTADRASLTKAVSAATEAMERGTDGAEVVGIHLEGPFLNPVRTGAQNPEYIRLATIEELDQYIRLSKGGVRLMTIAPEREGALPVIRYAVEHGIAISIGHSDATYEEMVQAVECGASHATHLFNGMRPLHHREPGVAGAALMLDELAVELICDGIHVRKELVSYVFRVKPRDKVVMITDCISAAGCPEGEYKLGLLPVVMKDGQVRLKNEDGSLGSLAGSSLTLDKALSNTLEFTGKALADILPALTINPARQIGVDDRKGSIERGKDADLVILNERFDVMQTFVKGRLVFQK